MMNRYHAVPGRKIVSKQGSGHVAAWGWWRETSDGDRGGVLAWQNWIEDLRMPLWIVERDGARELQTPLTGEITAEESGGLPVVGYVSPALPETMGDPRFCEDQGIRYPYLAGAMANGIGSVEIVTAMSRAGMLGFFGAAGLSPRRVGEAVDRIQSVVGEGPYGVNLIHTPQEPRSEAAVVDLLIEKGVHLAEASAYLSLTLPVVKYRVHGIHEDALGRIITPNQIIAKVSRVEVASKFWAPPPEKFLRQLVASGDISESQAQMAARVPLAQDITAEADSGGHTDNRPALTLLPTLMALRDQFQAAHAYPFPLRVGLAGGIATPASAAAAFAMGAAYILAGSIHQACVESGSSDLVRAMLAEARQADIAMAPAADMFEMGVNVQVLKRGTMFAMRAAKLYELYRNHESLEEIPAPERVKLEKMIFRASLEEVWSQTRNYFQIRDSAQIERAERDSKHKMALVFRWYLGKSSNWANAGEATRKIDYQVWCGPGMGAFNEWVKGSFLERPEQRRIVTVAQNILYGAAVTHRLNSLRLQGVDMGKPLQPKDAAFLKEYFH